MKTRVWAPLAAICMAWGAFTPVAHAQKMEKFTFALNWFAVGDHAAYWVALDKGYYRERGLDVTIENSKGSGESIAKVDTGAVPMQAWPMLCPSSPRSRAARRSRLWAPSLTRHP